ncbi:hypothetical protein [Arenimonas terrae]|jgi:hypothetical protein|uniref:Uncharacterized protein n=1 Tax=Arenimonas terrae TaxID=2546226 RepID=A0A5C4RTB2_9GAMM|nr:hypothetical protein [Arenimonas terrae]TNJ34420.1 hypothetical protein E1B00_01120 [Arenimonas terrae]
MDQPDAAESPKTELPGRTTPTWEMELLVSGATVFGLMQLPAQADRLVFGFYNASNFAVAALAPSLWIYIKFSLLTLIATFVVHLCLRGYWVALVGLHSVYPQGFRWDRMKARLGPHYLETSRELAGDIRTLIERADNRASVVFGLGFGMAMLMLMPMVLVMGMMAFIWCYETLGGDGTDALKLSAAMAALLFIVFGVMVYWDRAKGDHYPAGSRAGRWIRGFFRFYARLGFDRANNPLITLYGSNEGNRRTAVILGVVMFCVMSIVIWQALGDRLGWDVGDFDGLPDDVQSATDTVLPQHYASQRGDTPRLAPLPHIPDPVVRGGYVRLFVPYIPARHNEAMRLRCPQALEATGDDAQRERLECLEAMHAVTLDGQPLDIHFDAAEDPATGQRGMLAMIPVHALERGRHELSLQRTPRSDRKADDPPPKPYVIPFWL